MQHTAKPPDGTNCAAAHGQAHELAAADQMIRPIAMTFERVMSGCELIVAMVAYHPPN